MRRRQIFAQRSRSALDPSGAAGSGPAAVTPTPPVSREEEDARALIWNPPLVDLGNLRLADGTRQNIEVPAGEMWTPVNDPTAAPMVKSRKTLRLKKAK